LNTQADGVTNVVSVLFITVQFAHGCPAGQEIPAGHDGRSLSSTVPAYWLKKMLLDASLAFRIDTIAGMNRWWIEKHASPDPLMTNLYYLLTHR
jgi:hypothetical protein